MRKGKADKESSHLLGPGRASEGGSEHVGSMKGRSEGNPEKGGRREEEYEREILNSPFAPSNMPMSLRRVLADVSHRGEDIATVDWFTHPS